MISGYKVGNDQLVI